MNADVPRRRLAWPEFLLAGLVLAAFIHAIWFFVTKHYLPQPFTYDTNNTLWDYAIPAYWSHHPGAYDVWKSIYPPISFVFLRFFSWGKCYVNPAEDTANPQAIGSEVHCDWIARYTVIAIYFINVFLTYRALKKSDPSTSLARTVAIACGLPMLFAVERGNLILVCYTFLILGYSRLLRSGWAKMLCMAIAINFKPYMVMTVLPLAAKNRWRWIEGCGLLAVFVYLITLALNNDGTPMQLIRNQLEWMRVTSTDDWWSIYYSTTLTSFYHAIKGDYPLLIFIDSRWLEGYVLWVPLAIRLGQLGVLAAFFTAWLRPGAASAPVLGALGLTLVLTTTNPGGYVMLYLIFLVFLERWKDTPTGIAISCSYLLSIAYDYMLIGYRNIHQPSWLGNNFVATDFGISVGHLVRPTLVLVIQYALVASIFFTALRQARASRAYGGEPALSTV